MTHKRRPQSQVGASPAAADRGMRIMNYSGAYWCGECEEEFQKPMPDYQPGDPVEKYNASDEIECPACGSNFVELQQIIEGK